jgi:hypothetical protein
MELLLGERSRSYQLRLADNIGERVTRGRISLARRVLQSDHFLASSFSRNRERQGREVFARTPRLGRLHRSVDPFNLPVCTSHSTGLAFRTLPNRADLRRDLHADRMAADVRRERPSLIVYYRTTRDEAEVILARGSWEAGREAQATAEPDQIGRQT